jgi:hypothetical protein
MRYLFGFLCVCALAGTVPANASAQAGEEGATSEPNLQEPAPSSEPASEEPALKLKVDDAGVGVAPGYPPRFDEQELRVKQAEVGFLVSTGVFGAGALLVIVAGIVGAEHFASGKSTDWVDPAVIAGAALLVGGAAGMIASGVVRRKAKRKLRELQRAHYGPHRVQWDLAQSRVVF